jgi:hypothetical protein
MPCIIEHRLQTCKATLGLGPVQLRYGIPAPDVVRLSVLDLQGREVPSYFCTLYFGRGGSFGGWLFSSSMQYWIPRSSCGSCPATSSCGGVS